MGAKARASISGAGPGQTKGSCRNHNVSGGAVFSPSHATRAATRLPGQPTGPRRPRLRQQACLVALVRAVADVRANDAWALVGARGCPARPPRWLATQGGSRRTRAGLLWLLACAVAKRRHSRACRMNPIGARGCVARPPRWSGRLPVGAVIDGLRRRRRPPQIAAKSLQSR